MIKTGTQFTITDTKYEGDGWRMIKNSEGETMDFVEIVLPDLDAQVRIEFLPDGKTFNIYSNNLQVTKNLGMYVGVIAKKKTMEGGFVQSD